MHEIIHSITGLVADMGYLGIFLMMVIESSFFPFPSEIAMIPAGYLSSTGEMNFALAFSAGTLGAITGATINYLLGWKLGAPIIKNLVTKYGKYIFLSIQHYNKTEYFFLDHGSVATFIGRLITGIRQIISIPAGVFKMNYGKFLIFTAAGSGLWNLTLMIIGYLAGKNEDMITKYSFIAFLATFIIVGITLYTYIQRRKYPNSDKTSALILCNKEHKILIQNRENISKHGEEWAFFGGHIQYQETPRNAILREIQEQLGIDLSTSIKPLGKMLVKLPERHSIVKRHYFYAITDKNIEEINIGDGAQFITIEELKQIEHFSVEGIALKKLISLIEKAQKKIIKTHDTKSQ